MNIRDPDSVRRDLLLLLWWNRAGADLRLDGCIGTDNYGHARISLRIPIPSKQLLRLLPHHVATNVSAATKIKAAVLRLNPFDRGTVRSGTSAIRFDVMRADSGVGRGQNFDRSEHAEVVIAVLDLRSVGRQFSLYPGTIVKRDLADCRAHLDLLGWCALFAAMDEA
jgi:hypothetical protein